MAPRETDTLTESSAVLAPNRRVRSDTWMTGSLSLGYPPIGPSGCLLSTTHPRVTVLLAGGGPPPPGRSRTTLTCSRMAGWTGLEPATSDVTGRRSNQLNYHPARWLERCDAL